MMGKEAHRFLGTGGCYGSDCHRHSLRQHGKSRLGRVPGAHGADAPAGSGRHGVLTGHPGGVHDPGTAAPVAGLRRHDRPGRHLSGLVPPFPLYPGDRADYQRNGHCQYSIAAAAEVRPCSGRHPGNPEHDPGRGEAGPPAGCGRDAVLFSGEQPVGDPPLCGAGSQRREAGHHRRRHRLPPGGGDWTDLHAHYLRPGGILERHLGGQAAGQDQSGGTGEGPELPNHAGQRL